MNNHKFDIIPQAVKSCQFGPNKSTKECNWCKPLSKAFIYFSHNPFLIKMLLPRNLQEQKRGSGARFSSVRYDLL